MVSRFQISIQRKPTSLQEFDWSLRMEDKARQASVVADCQKLPEFKTENFLRMAEICRQGGPKHAGIQKECLSAALRQLTNTIPIQDFQLLARVRSYSRLLQGSICCRAPGLSTLLQQKSLPIERIFLERNNPQT